MSIVMLEKRTLVSHFSRSVVENTRCILVLIVRCKHLLSKHLKIIIITQTEFLYNVVPFSRSGDHYEWFMVPVHSPIPYLCVQWHVYTELQTLAPQFCLVHITSAMCFQIHRLHK